MLKTIPKTRSEPFFYIISDSNLTGVDRELAQSETEYLTLINEKVEATLTLETTIPKESS